MTCSSIKLALLCEISTFFFEIPLFQGRKIQRRGRTVKDFQKKVIENNLCAMPQELY